jgi:endonuclease/exonuclease/phosphatase family metal-dependent hydrolase
MTWNVNGGNNQAGTPNVDAQIALMASSGAQVIALQGVTISRAGDLSSLYQWKLEAATGHAWNALWIPGPAPLAPAHADGNLLLTTLPIAGSGTTAFDSAPMNPTLRDAKRSAGWIAVVVNNVTLHIATTQLAVDTTQRDEQLSQLAGWIATVPTPRLIGGDFQMLPNDATYRSMASGFRDVWTAVGPPGDPGLTQTLSSSQVGRFDYWWSELTGQRATPTAVWVVETSRSTHHAVVVDVSVQ